MTSTLPQSLLRLSLVFASVGSFPVWAKSDDNAALSLFNRQITVVNPAGSSGVEAEAALADFKLENMDTSASQSVPTAAVVVPKNSSAPRVSSQNADGQQVKAELDTAMKSAYKGVFFDNDFRYLDSPFYEGPSFIGDSFKGIANGKLDIGGEYRSRYHHEDNMRGLGVTGIDDQFWLTRLRLFANYRLNDVFRIYGEYLYADSAGENILPRPIEENRGDAQNLFVDINLLEAGSSKLTARLGRQELLFGAQRLVSPLDWANTRRTFDGYRMGYASSELDVDVFYTHPVNRVPATGGTNEWDSSNNQRQFYGAYLSCKGLDVGLLEAYYLGYQNAIVDFSYQTIGSRLVGASNSFLYELEGGVQFGKNANASEHGAGFVTAGLGRQMDWSVGGHGWKPTIWGWYDWASGGSNDFVNRGDNGFDDNFPLAHKYLGFMDLFGRRNINDANLQFIAPLGSRVNMLVWYHYFFLDQATTPYSVVMTPYNSNNAAGSKDLGHEIDLLLTVNLDPRNSMLLGYSYFASGKYYDKTLGVPANVDASFFYFQYQTRF